MNGAQRSADLRNRLAARESVLMPGVCQGFRRRLFRVSQSRVLCSADPMLVISHRPKWPKLHNGCAHQFQQ